MNANAADAADAVATAGHADVAATGLDAASRTRLALAPEAAIGAVAEPRTADVERAELLATTARAAFRRRLARLSVRLQSCRDLTPSGCRHALATTLADDAACREASLTRELAYSVRGDAAAEATLRPVLDEGCREWKSLVAHALDGTADAPRAELLADLLGYVSAGVTNKLSPAERAAEFDRLVTFLLDSAAR